MNDSSDDYTLEDVHSRRRISAAKVRDECAGLLGRD